MSLLTMSVDLTSSYIILLQRCAASIGITDIQQTFTAVSLCMYLIAILGRYRHDSSLIAVVTSLHFHCLKSCLRHCMISMRVNTNLSSVVCTQSVLSVFLHFPLTNRDDCVISGASQPETLSTRMVPHCWTLTSPCTSVQENAYLEVCVNTPSTLSLLRAELAFLTPPRDLVLLLNGKNDG